jgi:Ca2+-binding EF-hand superfamily protein
MAEEKLGSEIEVNLNSGSHKNITLHSIVVQVPDEEEETRDILGDQVTVIFGIGEKAVYLAAGSNPVPTLKKAVDGGDGAGSQTVKFIRSMPVFKLLDKNRDSAFSKREIKRAVVAFESLDNNEDGEISMEEMMPEQQKSELEKAQMVGVMQSLPIIKAMDKNSNNVISENENKGAVAALQSLDKNEDGTISMEEMMPGGSDMMQFNLFISPMLDFAVKMKGEPAIEAMAQVLKDSGGDRIRGTYNLVENGGIMRFEMQDGILGLIKVGFDAFSQGGGFPGQNDDF